MAIHVGRPDLVVRGPYRVFRHPMYSGLLLVGCGLVLNHVVAWRWGTLIILVAVLDIKARLEERELMQTFPDYQQYSRRTWRLVPPIY